MAKIRLYIDHPLASGQDVALTAAQGHYLSGVMRQGAGAGIEVFNGLDGTFAAQIAKVSKRGGVLDIHAQTMPQRDPPDVWLLFAPIKKARTDFIVEKATEMGVARILPVQTEFTNTERVRHDRLQAHAIEAAEQCGGNFVPQVTALRSLGTVLSEWDVQRRLLWADESGGGLSRLDALPRGPYALLIGPEGGFSPPEQRQLRDAAFVTPMSLGPRILRADTAAVAALTLFQLGLGDW